MSTNHDELGHPELPPTLLSTESALLLVGAPLLVGQEKKPLFEWFNCTPQQCPMLAENLLVHVKSSSHPQHLHDLNLWHVFLPLMNPALIQEVFRIAIANKDDVDEIKKLMNFNSPKTFFHVLSALPFSMIAEVIPEHLTLARDVTLPVDEFLIWITRNRTQAFSPTEKQAIHHICGNHTDAIFSDPALLNCLLSCQPSDIFTDVLSCLVPPEQVFSRLYSMLKYLLQNKQDPQASDALEKLVMFTFNPRSKHLSHQLQWAIGDFQRVLELQMISQDIREFVINALEGLSQETMDQTTQSYLARPNNILKQIIQSQNALQTQQALSTDNRSLSSTPHSVSSLEEMLSAPLSGFSLQAILPSVFPNATQLNTMAENRTLPTRYHALTPLSDAAPALKTHLEQYPALMNWLRLSQTSSAEKKPASRNAYLYALALGASIGAAIVLFTFAVLFEMSGVIGISLVVASFAALFIGAYFFQKLAGERHASTSAMTKGEGGSASSSTSHAVGMMPILGTGDDTPAATVDLKNKSTTVTRPGPLATTPVPGPAQPQTSLPLSTTPKPGAGSGTSST